MYTINSIKHKYSTMNDILENLNNEYEMKNRIMSAKIQ